MSSIKPLWLIVSLALNVVVLAVWWWSPSLVRDPNQEGLRPGVLSPASASATVKPVTAAAAAEMKLTSTAAEKLRTDTALLDFSDLKVLVAQLRAGGLPEPVVRMVFRALLSEKMQMGAEILPIYSTPYWKPTSYQPMYSAEVRAKNRLYRELVDEVLGPGAVVSAGYMPEEFGESPELRGVAPEKRAQVTAILRDYNDMLSEIRSQTIVNGYMVALPEEKQRMQYLETQKMEDLRRVLTSSELENYLLVAGETANYLRQWLPAFQPTEDEFRAIHRLLEQRTAAAGGLTGDTSADYTFRANALKEIQKELGSSLTPERVAELGLATDPRTSALARMLSRLELPLATAPKITAIQNDILGRAARVRIDSAIAPAERAKQLIALTREANQRVTEILGSRGMEAYQPGLGQWMSRIATAPTTAPRPR